MNSVPEVSGPARRGKRARRWRVGTFVVLVLSVATLVVVVLLSPLRVADTLPATVHGVWRTDAPAYADRRFELREHSVTFQVGQKAIAVTRHEIAQVRESVDRAGTRYVVQYLAGSDSATSAPLDFEFIYRPVIPSEIVFVNQRGIVWRRVPLVKREAPSPPPTMNTFSG